MPTVASLLPVSHLPAVSLQPHRPSSTFAHVQLPRTRHRRGTRPLIFASSASSFDELNSGPKSRSNNNSKKSTLLNLIQDIEPFDVSIIQKDVPPTTVDAMKRTISGMLGLLPSNRFQVLIEALWEPLSKLLVSSMMTGYTLRNAEYQLCLAKHLDIFKENFEQQKTESAKLDAQKMLLDSTGIFDFTEKNEMLQKSKKFEEDTSTSCNIGIQDLGAITPEAQQYIVHLQSRLSSVRKELHEIKRKNAALQMQQFVGEEKNDLLDYLRSLQPEKVAELSEPTSPQLKETIHSVVHGLLATLSPKMHSKSPLPPLCENTSGGALNFRNEEDSAELVEDTPLQFQPIISVTRDYLARLLFWCMLLGHYLRGLEYRLQLMELLTLSSNAESSDTCGGEQVI